MEWIETLHLKVADLEEKDLVAKEIDKLRQEAKALLKFALKEGYLKAEVCYLIGNVCLLSENEQEYFEAFEWFTTSIRLDESHINSRESRIAVCDKILGIHDSNNASINSMEAGSIKRKKGLKKDTRTRFLEYVRQTDRIQLSLLTA
jgi:hypothetical protein